jgi:hypothetical protein
MIIGAILIIAVGLLMLIKPRLVWYFTERWKSADAEEPSSFYIWYIRIGGIFFMLAGIGSAILYLMSL